MTAIENFKDPSMEEIKNESLWKLSVYLFFMGNKFCHN